ncbi:MAG: NAD+ synthase [Bacteroidales bacterium]
MKIALAQINLHIGNINDNTTRIVFCIKKAQQFNADLVIFPELSVCGYPPLDLLDYKHFTSKCQDTVKKIAKICTDIAVIIGSPSLNPGKEGKSLFNSAFFLYEGKIQSIHHKTLLPDYDVFDEYRYFEPNSVFNIVEYKGKRIAITICEDLWFDQNFEDSSLNKRLYTVSPMEKLAQQNPDFIVNISASPFSRTNIQKKKDVFINTSKKYGLPIFMVNQVGANTDLIFEGGSLVINDKGEIFDRICYFEEDFQIYELQEVLNAPAHGTVPAQTPGTEMIYRALVLGIKDFFAKSGFRKALLGISGGLDSSVTAVIAADALGNENVYSVFMPSGFSSPVSREDAGKLAANIGVSYNEIEIDNLIDSFSSSLAPLFKNLPEDTTEENIQARIRGTLLMAMANKFGLIMLNTSNKSESAVGYATLYGDTNGALSVLGDVYKTQVYELARYINRNEIIIPESTIKRAPSAELKENQKDTDSLPDYDLLDKILFRYIEQKKDVREIAKEGFDRKLVEKILHMVNSTEYKRYQSPPVLRISSKAFGKGRAMPLVAKF